MKLWTDFVEFLCENYQWFFSGTGVLLLSGLFVLLNRKQSSQQKQSVKNGNAIQVGRDFKMNERSESENV